MTKKTIPKSEFIKARRKLRLKRPEAADRLNVSPELIKAFDDWDFESLPELREPLHMTLRRYSRMVGLSASKMEEKLPANLKPSPAQFTKRKGLFFVSRAGYLLVISLIVALFLGFLGWRAIRANAVPELTIQSPSPNAILTAGQVEITGQTSEGAQVFINGTSVPVETNGDFKGQVILAPGPNTIEIRAINSFARENTQERIIIRSTP